MSEILRKALLATTSQSGENLIPEDLEPALVEYLAREQPLFMFMERQKADGKTHEYNKRTAVPEAWFEGELTDIQAGSSTYDRESVQLKILRTWGGVSGFQQRMSERFINALESEIVGSMEGLADLFEYSMLWGNKNDAYQFDGLDTFIANDAQAGQLISAGGNILSPDNVVTLTHLDDMIDAATGFRGVGGDPKAFIMSRQMISKITGLQTKIQRSVQQIEFEGGFRMATYRDVPLVPSDFVRPRATTTSPTVTATAAAGGTMVDGTYHYGISSVTMFGEQLVGATDSATTATSNNSVALTWTADPAARLYKVWRGSSATTMKLLTVIPAKTYDSAGAVNGTVAAYTDTGAATVNTAIDPLTTGHESIFLANFNPDRGAALVGNLSPLGERTDNFVSYVPLATRKSAFEYMIESFAALKVPHARLHAVARRVKLA